MLINLIIRTARIKARRLNVRPPANPENALNALRTGDAIDSTGRTPMVTVKITTEFKNLVGQPEGSNERREFVTRIPFIDKEESLASVQQRAVAQLRRELSHIADSLQQPAACGAQGRTLGAAQGSAALRAAPARPR
ncbi:hypothetical protein SAMN04488103_102463 [Gemmobacter aquatilis]|uniref:Uncharacterized protein n=1 Tax=Gemmobacter aquatilis TaxID=933059 RepID=A0A1H8CEW2_9RHOB|nr:hypothetical protein [Gemmobacter aquatilis]SEM92637.1 hypothetical protein SAMN04488103_102463 [Gemmobacter aquatilis]